MGTELSLSSLYMYIYLYSLYLNISEEKLTLYLTFKHNKLEGMRAKSGFQTRSRKEEEEKTKI
jgi:hypothetical protein